MEPMPNWAGKHHKQGVLRDDGFYRMNVPFFGVCFRNITSMTEMMGYRVNFNYRVVKAGGSKGRGFPNLP